MNLYVVECRRHRAGSLTNSLISGMFVRRTSGFSFVSACASSILHSLLLHLAARFCHVPHINLFNVTRAHCHNSFRFIRWWFQFNSASFRIVTCLDDIANSAQVLSATSLYWFSSISMIQCVLTKLMLGRSGCCCCWTPTGHAQVLLAASPSLALAPSLSLSLKD